MNNAKIQPPKQPDLTFAQLGKIILEKFGADAIRRGYGFDDPESDLDSLGRVAIAWNDINRDGTLN